MYALLMQPGIDYGLDPAWRCSLRLSPVTGLPASATDESAFHCVGMSPQVKLLRIRVRRLICGRSRIIGMHATTGMRGQLP